MLKRQHCSLVVGCSINPPFPCYQRRHRPKNIWETENQYNYFFIVPTVAVTAAVYFKNSEPFFIEKWSLVSVWIWSEDGTEKRLALLWFGFWSRGLHGGDASLRVCPPKKAETDFDMSVASFCAPGRWYCWANLTACGDVLTWTQQCLCWLAKGQTNPRATWILLFKASPWTQLLWSCHFLSFHS